MADVAQSTGYVHPNAARLEGSGSTVQWLWGLGFNGVLNGYPLLSAFFWGVLFIYYIKVVYP